MVILVSLTMGYYPVAIFPAADFPLNDGGLFYDGGGISTFNYSLPDFTS
jgi:hypothetical protein